MEKEKKKTTKKNTTKKKETIDLDQSLSIIRDEIEKEWTNAVESTVKKYIEDSINKEVLEQFEKANRKVLKEKNRKILWKNITIIILIGIIGFLLYLLYGNNFFNNITKKEEKTTVIEKVEEKKEPTLEELKEQYASLINDITISDKSSYLEDFYNGNITKELKKYFVLNTMDFNKLEVEEDYNVINEKEFKEQYGKVWNDTYQSSNFEYNNQKIRYFNKLQSYISERILEKDQTNIAREIIEIKVDKEIIQITTIEGIIEEDTLKNCITKEIIEDYNGDSIINYQDQLNRITYVFNHGKLETIKK